MTEIRKQVIQHLNQNLQERIIELLFDEELPAKEVMNRITPLTKNFSNEMLNITYNYCKYLEFLKNSNQNLNGVFYRYLDKLDEKFGSEQNFTQEDKSSSDYTELLDERERDRQKYEEMMRTIKKQKKSQTKENHYYEAVDNFQHYIHNVSEDAYFEENPINSNRQFEEETVEDSKNNLLDSLIDKESNQEIAVDEIEGSVEILKMLKAILTTINDLGEKYVNLLETMEEVNHKIDNLEVTNLKNISKIIHNNLDNLNKHKTLNNSDFTLEEISDVRVTRDLSVADAKLSDDFSLNDVEETTHETFNDDISVELEVSNPDLFSDTFDDETIIMEENSDLVQNIDISDIKEDLEIGDEISFEGKTWEIVGAFNVINSKTKEREARLRLKNVDSNEEIYVGIEDIEK